MAICLAKVIGLPLVCVGRVEGGWGAGGAVGWRSWEIRRTSGVQFARCGVSGLPAWGVGLGGPAAVTVSQEAVTSGCCLCTV